MTNAPWPSRMWFRCKVFDGKMWVFGGFDGTGFVSNKGTNDNYSETNFNDVWFTTDGINWEKLKTSTVYSKRHAPTAYVYDNSIWIVGGKCANTYNDVWRLKLCE